MIVDQPNGKWQLDKKVPLAVLVLLALQTCALIWWAAGMSFRVDQLEKDSATRAPQADRIVRLELKVDNINDRVSEIKGLLTPLPILPQRR